ncbi:PREDICTED: protein ECERIFERUM 1 [Ipomoea nil]|uniref:protein ECERIFERUM 1 n=1 Tax=Ipomoea nil TaxID=35883 RepID=UPI000901BBBC|nr:PREDICTED: protein ECERIFERUM 1 [Ipomoea nil]
MESPDVENIVYDHRLSSVVPATITGEGRVLNLTNADLAMKLHYLRGVYLFRSEAVDGLNTGDLKSPMFRMLEDFYPAAGRIRTSPEDGRPFVKCNDSGVRIVEAKCSKTIDEWLDMSDQSEYDHLLHHDQVLGPDLGFSPLVFIQITWFKCGGLSIGISWAHVLGDAFSLSDFLNKYGPAMAGRRDLPPKHPHMPTADNHNSPKPRTQKLFPFSLGSVGPVGDHWKLTNTCKMATQSYHITDKQLNALIFKVSGLKQSAKVKPFEAISALFWKSLAKVKEGSGLETVTIVKNGFHSRGNGLLPCRNGQVISAVKAEMRVSEADVLELANLIGEKAVDETGIIDETMEEENGKSADFFVYGANLTFVNLEEVKIYGFDMKGQKPIFANYTIGGVGDEGAVLVLPGPENLKGKEGGRIVNVILPEHLLGKLKNEISKELGTSPN